MMDDKLNVSPCFHDVHELATTHVVCSMSKFSHLQWNQSRLNDSLSRTQQESATDVSSEFPVYCIAYVLPSCFLKRQSETTQKMTCFKPINLGKL